MLNEGDERWLRDNVPGLIATGDTVAGTIEFKASYDSQEHRFVILGGQPSQELAGQVLSGTFQVRIQNRTDKSTSQLPALYVEAIEPTPDRHFGQCDNSACLCSPFDEREFLQPELQFRRFLEELVIPFLYGQVFYSSNGHWPWPEYAHGATGILEAYSKIPERSRAEECLSQLARDMNWPRIRSALQQQPHIKGHTPCFCTKMDQIRRCHPDALEGVRRLQQDLRTLGIAVA
jgi:hypothetical protein